MYYLVCTGQSQKLVKGQRALRKELRSLRESGKYKNRFQTIDYIIKDTWRPALPITYLYNNDAACYNRDVVWVRKVYDIWPLTMAQALRYNP